MENIRRENGTIDAKKLVDSLFGPEDETEDIRHEDGTICGQKLIDQLFGKGA